MTFTYTYKADIAHEQKAHASGADPGMRNAGHIPPPLSENGRGHMFAHAQLE